MASPPASVKELRHACAVSGFHEHDGCSCSDEELIRRASSPPVASPPASVEEIARRIVVGIIPAETMDQLADDLSRSGLRQLFRSYRDQFFTKIKAALLSDRAAMAERVAGLERVEEENDQLVSDLLVKLDASEAEVARLREALEPFAERASQYDDRRGDYTVSILVEMLRKARAALTRPDEPTKET